ncbi:formate--tetrahydrofolate ligase, partial [Halobellus sp. Atlit-38R]|uniref:formate--tetrahydrofolate ligase n=1 Tax=Halobellus sp. Atlit-38R TaxID=2282131 RepID=UPI000EF2188B
MAPTDPASDATGVPESDLAVARATDPRAIEEVAADLGLSADDVERRGDGVAKLTHAAVRDAVGDGADASGAAAESAGTTVLVTGMSPTPKGEGKTVTTVGLGQGLAALGER